MRLVKLTIGGFGSFTETQVVTFPTGPGLYFVGGRNLVEPRLDANGSGKSTIWEALTWLFFDKTTKGLRAGDITTWGSDGKTSVSAIFEIAGLGYHLSRTRAPNTWRWCGPDGVQQDLTKDSTNEALSALRLQYLPFLSCVVLAQSAPMFMDLPAPAKAGLFAEILQLDKWGVHATAASTAASDTDRALRAEERQLASEEGRFAEMLVSQKHEVDAENQWQQENQRLIAECEARYRKLLEEEVQLKANVAAADLTLSNTRRGLATARDESTKELEKVEALYQSWHACSVSLSTARAVVQQAEAALLSAKSLKQDHCPTCQTTLTEAKRVTLVDSAARNLARHKEQEQHDQRNHTAAQQKLEQAEQLLAKAKEKVALLEREHNGQGHELQNYRTALSRAQLELDNLEEEVDRLETKKNPYAGAALRRQQRQDDSARVISTLRATCDKLSELTRLQSYWVKWFKDIRLQQVDQALEHLELEVNSSLSELGLPGWTILFDVDRETKGGTISKGFSVRVLGPSSPQSVPWESWSGGESQRLRLAVTMGLANMIRARTGCPLGLEVWDEPTQWLSAQGVSDLLECLRRRALAEQRQIWVVDHRTLGYSGFSGQLVVTKTHTGSQVSSGYEDPQ